MTWTKGGLSKWQRKQGPTVRSLNSRHNFWLGAFQFHSDTPLVQVSRRFQPVLKQAAVAAFRKQRALASELLWSFPLMCWLNAPTTNPHNIPSLPHLPRAFFFFFYSLSFWEGSGVTKSYGNNAGVSNWVVHIFHIEILEQSNLSFHLFKWLRCSLSFKRYFAFHWRFNFLI